MELGSADAEPKWAGRLARTPFAAALAKGAPLIVASGDPAHVEFATPAALTAFGVADVGALGRVLFASDNLSSRRLLRLSQDMAVDGPARLELLRFFVDRRPVSVFWLCARVRRGEETFFVAADPAAAETADRGEPARDDATSSQAPVRFVWRLDRDGRYGATDPKLTEVLGDEAPREGEALDALVARVGLGPEWGENVKARTTFSGLRLAWPEPGREVARVVRLSGAPLFGAAQRYEGVRGFGVFAGERVKMQPPERPKPPRPVPAKLSPPGDAAALISLLQRQHPSTNLAAPSANSNAPALAIISALANLLAPKAASVAPRPATPSVNPSTGAEIVMLRPHVVPAPEAAAEARDSVSLNSQERAAFKEIARALGAKVRDARPEPDTARPPSPPEPDPPAEPGEVATPAEEDLAALLDILPIAALVARDGEALYANRTLLDLTGYRDLADFRARDAVKSIFRGRDPRTLAPGGAVAGIPLVASGERLLTVDALVRPAVWRGAPRC